MDLLDGKEVNPSEKIKAKQNLDNLTIDLYTQIEMKKIEKANKKKEEKPIIIENEENAKDDSFSYIFRIFYKILNFFQRK